MKKRMTAVALCLFFLLGFWLMPGQMQVMADEVGYFSGDVSLLKEMENSYVFQVDVGNGGEDFQGLVRLRFLGASDDASCCYEQEISIPSGGQKQYKVTIPASNIERTKGSGMLQFVNQKGKILQKIYFKDVLGGKTSGIQVGILSDDYDSLTYLDMGGEAYSMGSSEKPIRLVKLDKDKVADALDGLYFLIIDHFDTAALDKKTIEAVEKWVNQGGCLMLGTGSYGEQTLSGFAPDYLGVAAGEVSTPGEDNLVSDMASGGNYYYAFSNAGINFTQMSVAGLTLTGQDGFEPQDVPAFLFSKGRGCAGVFVISLGEKEMQKAGTNSDVARSIYDSVSANAMSFGTGDDGDWGYYGRSAFGRIDHEYTDVNFTFPKFLMFFYVILVGPLLYLILRAVKKRECYWAVVPALSLVFVGILFLYGQSAKISRTNLYSLSVQEASGEQQEEVETYFSGYHSGVKPWSVKLKDHYTYGGTGLTSYDYVGNSEKDHYVVNYGDGVRIGMNPESNFETGFLYAAGTGTGHGTIKAEDIRMDEQTLSGTIENQTDYDFPYLALRAENSLIVVKNVQAGETLDLSKIHKNSRVVYETNYAEEFYYDMVENMNGYGKDENPALLAALSIGMNAANDHRYEGQVMICGIVPVYEKTVDEKCREISMGCLYRNVEQEGNHASN